VPGATEAPRRNTYFSQKWSKMGTREKNLQMKKGRLNEKNKRFSIWNAYIVPGTWGFLLS
jgi:hypothetical protein